MTDPMIDPITAAFSPISIHILLCAIFASLLCWAACCDAIRRRIPNAASLAIACLFPAYAATAPGGFPWLLAALIAAALLVLGVIAFSHGLIGGGDAKLISATALWAGPERLLDFLFITAVAGGVLGLAALFAARHAGLGGMGFSDGKLPYGIAIATGGFLAVLIAPAI